MDKSFNRNITDFNNLENKYEVLAPAGSYECMLAAFSAGADAVYVGGQLFGARAFANNFNQEELTEAINYAHLHNKKLFLTINTLLKNQEIENKLIEYLVPLYEAGLDAVIVQDFGVLTLVKKHFPDMDIHASTQMTVTGQHFAKELKSLGVTRIVPARELSLNEIEEIYNETGMEIECFVHGALCYCYSGMCLLSSLIGARSGNRGRCAQPCRLPYDVLFDDEKKYEQYPLSPKDLCTLKLLPKILKAGVYSLKIEGRMKKPEYVASVTAMYRKYVDMYASKGEENYKVAEEDIKLLMDIYNRGGFTEGYYEKHNGKELMSTDRPNHMGVKVANITNINIKNKQISAIAIENISQDDVLEIYLPKGQSLYIKTDNIQKNQQFNVGFNSISMSKNERIDYNKLINLLNKSTSIMRTRNNMLIKDIQNRYINQNLVFNRAFGGHVSINKDCPISVDIWMDEYYVHLDGPMPELASNRPVNSEDIVKQFNKTGGTGFVLDKDNFEVTLEDGLFVNIKDLNMLRRDALEQLATQVLDGYRRKYNCDTTISFESRTKNSTENKAEKTLVSALVSNLEQLNAVIANRLVDIIYAELDMFDFLKDNACEKFIDMAHNKGKKIMLALPYITRTHGKKYLSNIKPYLEKLDIDGYLFRNMETVCMFDNMRIEQKCSVFDNSIYGFNDYAAKFLAEYKPTMLTASYELNKSELMHMDNSTMELCVYGYIPVMISAGCIKKTYNKCDSNKNILYLKDRLGNEFININHCKYCYNVLYNSSPLYLYDLIDEINLINPKAIRLNFVHESSKEVNAILDGVKVNNFTRGHYKRGVE